MTESNLKHLEVLEFIEEELYKHIEEDEVKKYYQSTINYLKELLKK